MKIKDFVVGNMIEAPLVVKQATARETKAKKPYLAIEFFDGQDTISGNYWDWTTGNIPTVNAILNVKAQVSEWQGNKQLNIKTMTTCTDCRLEDFMPRTERDVDSFYSAALGLMKCVGDETLRTIGIAVLEELKELWLIVPGAVRVHHNYVGGTLIHSYNTACIARSIANDMDNVDIDLVTVGAMLHDLGKLFTYRFEGVKIDKTMNGKLYEHLFIGAEFIGNFADAHVDTDNPYVYGKVRLLRHIILSHHGSLEFGSPVTPQCIEAYIVHHADALDAIHEQLVVASSKTPDTANWTEKIWTLNNSQHLTTRYTRDLMDSIPF